MDSHAAIFSVLGELYQSGGDGNFAIFHLGPLYYIQVAVNRGGSPAYCEAVGNHYLDPEHQLSGSQIDMLNRLGWMMGDSGNYFLEHTVDSPRNREDLACIWI
jgi:hypothetical protein